MSPFLRQLVQRSIAPASSLQPRLASRFETVGAPVGFPEVRADFSAPVASRAAERASTGRVLADAQPPSPRSEHPAPITPPAFVAGQPAADRPTVNVSTAEPPSARPDPLPRQQDPAPASPAMAVSAFSAPGNAPQQILAPPVASPATLLIERVIERRAESPLAREAAPPLHSAPAPPRLGSPQLAPTLPVNLHGSLAPPTPPARATAATTPPPSPIRVTIGRVDIRAIHSPPPTPVPVAAAERRPLVSLEAYLSRRDAP